MEKNNTRSSLFSDYLKNKPFLEVLPWIGGDLQTLRDTFVIDFDKSNKNEKILFPINKILSEYFECDYLLGFLELPDKLNTLKGFVIVTHGLGGSTKRFGLKRISRKLVKNGFGVLKLNLRGAGPARYLAKGNYCARCSSDVISAIKYFKKLINLEFEDLIKGISNFPIYGVGLSLGGTILLNACLDYEENNGEILLDGLACVSSPLDLSSCSLCIEKPRNSFYQKWLLHRLKNQLWDGFNDEGKILNNKKLRKKIIGLKTIKKFENYPASKNIHILRSKADCLRICKNGPILLVWPDGIWYEKVSPERISEIFYSHIINGKPIERWIFKITPFSDSPRYS